MQLWRHWKIKTTNHYLLHCSNYLNERMTLLSKLQNVEESNLDRNYPRHSEIFFFSDYSFKNTKNKSVLIYTIKYIPLIPCNITIYWNLPSMNWGDLILIRLLLVSLNIDFHFVWFSLCSMILLSCLFFFFSFFFTFCFVDICLLNQ